MKNLKELIEEKLKVNSKTNIHTQNPKDWTIMDAENGDFVVWTSGPLYFIYKCLNKECQINETPDNTIVFHVLYNPDQDKLYIGPDTGIGDADISRKNVFKLASDKECQILLNGLEKHGYKWDDKKLKVTKK